MSHALCAAEKIDILIVDDWQPNLDALVALLDRPDLHLVQAISGAQALKEIASFAALQREFALVVLDVMMPEMNGFECAKLIRSTAGYSQTPILFVSAVANDMDFIFKGYSAGAIDYIVKPIEPVIFKAKVALFMELFRARQLLKQQLRAAQALCQRLEQEHAEGRADRDYLLAQIKAYHEAFDLLVNVRSPVARPAAC